MAKGGGSIRGSLTGSDGSLRYDPLSQTTVPGGVSDTGVGSNASSSASGSAGAVGSVNELESDRRDRDRAEEVNREEERERRAPEEREAPADRARPAREERQQRAERPSDLYAEMFPESADRDRRARQWEAESALDPDVSTVMDDVLGDELAVMASQEAIASNFGTAPRRRRESASANSLDDTYVDTDIADFGDYYGDLNTGVVGDTVSEVLNETQRYDRLPSAPAAPEAPVPAPVPPTAPAAAAPAAVVPPAAVAPQRPADVDVDDLWFDPDDMPRYRDEDVYDADIPADALQEPQAQPAQPFVSLGQAVAQEEQRAAQAEGSRVWREPPEFHPNAHRDRTPMDQRRERSERRTQRNIREIRSGYFRTSGEETRNDGRTVLSEDVSQAIFDMCSVYGLEEDVDSGLVYSMVRMYMSLTPDFSGKWFRTEDELVLEDWAFVRAVNDMIQNQIVHGWPFRMSQSPMRYAETRCFPTTVMPQFMFERLTENPDSALYGMSWSDALEIGLSEWQYVRTSMLANNAPASQMRVIEDFQRAIAEMSGIDAEQRMGIPPVEYQPVDEAVNVSRQAAESFSDPDVRAAARAAADAQRSTFDSVVSNRVRRGERLHGGRDEFGNFADSRDAVEHFPECFLRTLTKMSRGLSALDPLLLGSALLEKASGTASHFAAAKASFIGNREFAPTNAAYAAAKDPRVQEMLEGYAVIVATMGQDRLVEFCATGRAPTKENIAEFARPYQKAASGRAVERMRRLSEWTSGVVSNAMAADWFMRGSDAARFLDNYMLRMAENSRRGDPYMTGQQLGAFMTSDPVSAVVDMMRSMEGQRAFAQMRGRTNGGATIMSEPIADFFRRHGVCDSFFAIVVGEKFLVYGTRAAEKYMPMLNTFQLMAYKIGSGITGRDIDQMRRSELLLSKSFKDCLIVDAMNLATTFGKFALCMAVISMMGIEPPDDERKMNMWDEWKIGGVPWREAWYLDDFLTWSMPLAIAVSASQKGGDPWKIFMDGMCDTLGGLGPFDVAKFVLNFDEAVVQSQRVADDPDAIGPDSELDFFMTQLAVTGVETFSEAVTPRFIRQIYRSGIDENSKDHTYQMVYTGKADPETGEFDMRRASYFESELRRATAKDPLVGFLFNVGSGYYTPNPSGEARTGWMYDDMPVATISDAMGLYSAQRFSVRTMGDDITKPVDKDDEIQKVVDDVIENVIDEFDSTEQVAATGIVIPEATRYYVSSYLYAQMNMITNEYHERLAIPGEFSDNGLTYEENKARKNEWFAECEARKAELEAKVNFIWDPKIPADVPKYERWRTNWQQIYTDSSGGQTDELGYLINKGASMLGLIDDKVTVETVAYGDFRNPVLQVVEDVYRDKETGKSTFDYQTPVVWWSSAYSDWDKIREFVGDATVPSGRFEGQGVMDVLTSNGQILEDGGWQSVPVIGSRAYVAAEPERYDFLKPDQDDPNLWTGNLKEAGKAKDWDDSSSYSPSTTWGIRSYRRSGGGGGYSPKIYSNPRSINVDKGSTMYTKRPYNAQTSYLRPAVYTKGSREAYRRQDM